MLLNSLILWISIPLFTIFRNNHKLQSLSLFGLTFILGLFVLSIDLEFNQDRFNYRNYVSIIEEGGLAPIEPIYYFLIKILSLFFSDKLLQDTFIVTVAFISISIKVRLFTKYSYSLLGSLASYLAYYFYLHDVTQIRIGLAVCFIYISWFSLLQFKRLQFYIFGLLAISCHLSSIIFILGHIFINYQNFSRNRKNLILLFLFLLTIFSLTNNSIAFVALDFIGNLFNIEKVSYYLESHGEGGFTQINFIRLIPHILFALLFFLNMRYWNKILIVNLLIQIYVCGIISFILLSPIPVLAYRISDILLFSGVFLIGHVRSFMNNLNYLLFLVVFNIPILFYTLEYSGLFETAH